MYVSVITNRVSEVVVVMSIVKSIKIQHYTMKDPTTTPRVKVRDSNNCMGGRLENDENVGWRGYEGINI
jgi:hypothetical protein